MYTQEQILFPLILRREKLHCLYADRDDSEKLTTQKEKREFLEPKVTTECQWNEHEM